MINENEVRSEARTSKDSSEERSDSRESGHGPGESGARTLLTDGGDEIPLNIAGHEDREPPSGAESFSFAEASQPESEPEAEADDEETVEPVELLVQLAKDGEINPWDIDIVAVTDRFLEAIEEVDLRTSGRALFYASVLLRMKGDELFAVAEPEDDELPPWEAPFADESDEPIEPGFDPIVGLEAEMDRRLERKQARGKPETLDELVRELRDAERGSWWKSSRTYDTSESPQGFSRGVQELSYHSGDDFRVDDEPTADDVTHTAHAEDIEVVIDDVEAALEEQYENGRDEVLFVEIEQEGGSRVMSYLALLFLAHRGRVTLEQDELFGDLWIKRVTVAAEPTEAIAD